MSIAKKFIPCLFVCLCLFALKTLAASDEITGSLLESTESNLFSQTNITIVSLSLLADAVKDDNVVITSENKKHLAMIIENLGISNDSLSSIIMSSEIASYDVKLLRLFIKSNTYMIAAAKNLDKYCDDGDPNHFLEYAANIQGVGDTMGEMQSIVE